MVDFRQQNKKKGKRQTHRPSEQNSSPKPKRGSRRRKRPTGAQSDSQAGSRPPDDRRKPAARKPAARKQDSRGRPPKKQAAPNRPAVDSPPGEAGRVIALLGSESYEPMDRKQIAASLDARGGAVKTLYTTLDDLEKTGRIARIRHNRYVLPREANLRSGIIQMHSKGFGHLLSEEPGVPDIFIAPSNTGTAMHRDRVLVREIPGALRRRRPRDEDDRSEGEVVRILERANANIVGTLERSAKFLYVIPDDPRLPQNVYVQAADDPAPSEATVGDKVVVRMREWKSRHVNPEGEIIEVLGRADAPGIDILSILRKYHLPTDFPENVLNAAANTPDHVRGKDTEDRDDWRDRFVVTIDPSDAKDFDDAFHVERLPSGWRLAVHIADVSHYVEVDSPLDKEASRRGNSVYLPDRVVPMLPERLSNGICSLVPDQDRLTRLALIDFDRDGRMRKAVFRRAVIRSARRLTYAEALDLLEGQQHSQLAKSLKEAWDLASLLRKNRFKKGSLDLDFPEVKVRVDDQGTPVAIEKVAHDISHQLIEEFMLAANEAVASEFLRRNLPSIYRVHEDPDPQRLAEFSEFVRSHGISCGDLTVRDNVSRLLASIRGTHEEYGIKLGLLKSLQKARYDPQPLGHYGLAKSNYCHFTSPIRRYADLVVHRAMLSLLENPPDKRATGRNLPKSTTLKETADHISATERNAQEAERDAVKLKKLEFFARQLEKRKKDAFDAVVTEIRPHGMFVELPDYVQTGFIRVSSLEGDFFAYDSAHLRLTGRRSRQSFQMGDRLQVVVDHVDFFKQHVDFTLQKN